MERGRTAVVLVGLSTLVALLFAAYGIVNRTLQAHALNARHGWHQPLSVNLDVPFFIVWLYSILMLVPASAIGASALLRHARSGRLRATAFVALMCIGIVGQYWGGQRAASPPRIGTSSWLHDGRSWFAFMCLLAIAVFTGAVILLKDPAQVYGNAEPGLSGVNARLTG